MISSIEISMIDVFREREVEDVERRNRENEFSLLESKKRWDREVALDDFFVFLSVVSMNDELFHWTISISWLCNCRKKS